MMTMAVERGVRRRRGDYKVTTRQRRGNKDATAIGYGALCGRGNEAINKRITKNRIFLIKNQIFTLIFFASFPHDTKVTNTTNEMAIRTECY
jgi:hypothetical protein